MLHISVILLVPTYGASACVLRVRMHRNLLDGELHRQRPHIVRYCARMHPIPKNGRRNGGYSRRWDGRGREDSSRDRTREDKTIT